MFSEVNRTTQNPEFSKVDGSTTEPGEVRGSVEGGSEHPEAISDRLPGGGYIPWSEHPPGGAAGDLPKLKILGGSSYL